MISAVVVTYNEENKLRDCLKSLRGKFDEIVIFDLGSEDNTLEIAKQFKANIYSHPKVDYVEKVRNLSVEKAKGEWVLVLDADERINENLWVKLKGVINEGKYVAVKIPRKNIFFGKWIAHSNWWPDKHVRFFKKGKVSWSDKIHHYPLVDGRALELPAKENLAIEHFGYSTFEEFINRQNRYSQIEALNLYQLGERFSWLNFFQRPFREFLVRFIRHRGFLDGFYGFALTYLMMVYQLQVVIALWELERKR